MTRKHSEVFLQGIHIQGFKSFADKIKLELQAGLSVIVGPNGSGKSNVADAVRWVLGEQSAKSLRGNKMEDVIFSGSSSRKSVGMAEVSLIFNNESGMLPLEYDEVVITRRVYRDGEGQYFINRTPCRLKDIQELLLDTGSGKEGFSIIGQGRVEEILNLKSEERRMLIEEVAGISKFRLRKKEASKKLEDADQNVERIYDILLEVEARLEPLAQQAEVAKRSQQLSLDLKRTEIALIINELLATQKSMQKVQPSILQFQEEMTALTTKITENEAHYIGEKVHLNRLEQQIQDLQGQVFGLENEAQEYSHELHLLSERIGFFEENLARLDQEVQQELDKQKDCLEKQKKIQEKASTLEAELAQQHGNLHQQERELAQIRAISGGTRLEELKTEIFEELSIKSRLTNEMADSERKQKSIQQQLVSLASDIEAKEKQKEELQQELKRIEQQTLELVEREQELSLQSVSTNQSLLGEQASAQERENQLSLLRRKTDQAAARHQALQSLEDQMEGYQKGVREILSAYRKKTLQSGKIYGTVAENITVAHKYELAVETALGGALQNILLESTEDGKACIEYLKKNQFGRATFLPLDAIRGGRIALDQKTLQQKGYLGLAVDLVQTDENLRSIMEFLLGRILIAEDMNSAIILARSNQYRYRVVTLQGDQVNIGGSLTGGSSRSQNSGLLSRSREIGELRKTIEDDQKKIEEIRKDLTQKRNRILELQLGKDSIDTESKRLQEAKGICAVEKKHMEERIRYLLESLKSLLYEKNHLNNEFEKLDPQRKTIQESIRGAEQRLIALQQEQIQLEQQTKHAQMLAEELMEQMTARKVESAKWEQELRQTDQSIQEEANRITQSEHSIQNKKSEAQSILQSKLELHNKQAELNRKIIEKSEELAQQRYLLIQLRSQKEQRSEEIIVQEERIFALKRQEKELEQLNHQNELKMARWQTEWETGTARLQEEYQLSWEEAIVYQSDEKKDILAESISRMKHVLEELGPVNYTAIEEYPETIKRFEFLSHQKQDLVEAGNTLRALIAELEKSMSERFAEGFHAVNEAFQEVFTELFNGGKAELVLDDPDNMLETGVKIIAQPPGKKAQLLSLLSGGERAFTAIALLFSFLKVKPSPFCLLDEIEAALDESNVKRFVQYLHKLSANTQFIVISHRRGTMELADRLYGVTMEESGVSKLLTVALQEEKVPAKESFV